MALPTSGLILDLDGEGVAGGVLPDQSGAGNHFTLYGSPVVEIGFDGTNTVTLDGVNDEARCPGNNILTGSFTVAVMVNLSAGNKFKYQQGWDGYGLGWSISLDISETHAVLSIVSAAPIEGQYIAFMFPEAMTDKNLLVFFRYQSGSVIDISYNELRTVAAKSLTNTGLRTSTYGTYTGRGHYSSTYYASEFSRVLSYTRYLSDSELDDILLAFKGFYVSGYVALDGVPASGTAVRLYLESNGRLVGATTTKTDGSYHQVLSSNAPVYAMALPPSGYQPITHGPISPIAAV